MPRKIQIRVETVVRTAVDVAPSLRPASLRLVANAIVAATDRRCHDCGGPIESWQRVSRYCKTCNTGARRVARSRRRKRERERRREGAVVVPLRLSVGVEQAGSDDWYRVRKAIDPGRARAHGLYRYSEEDEEAVAALFEPFYKSPWVVRRVVRQTGGLVMPKYPLPGRDPIPPQLNPDADVETNPVTRWHRHDLRRQPRLGARKAKHRGAWGFVMGEEVARSHIERTKGDRYDAKTGEGDHHCKNVRGWHKHAPRRAKYVNFGPNQRIDVGPDGLESIERAYRVGELDGVLFVLEGKLKHLSCESNGWRVVSVASVTLWHPDEVRELASWARDQTPGTTFYIGPDADWANFERNHGAVFRQATYVQTIFREQGVEAFILAPPCPEGAPECDCKPGEVGDDGLCARCGGYLKGFDDWYAAGGSTNDLVVLDRRAPEAEIAAFVGSLAISHQRKARTARALRGLSLHDLSDRDLLDVPLKTLQRIMALRKPKDVPEVLRDLTGALDVSGSLEVEKCLWWNEEKNRYYTVSDWTKRPLIVLREEFRASERTVRVGDLRRGAARI